MCLCVAQHCGHPDLNDCLQVDHGSSTSQAAARLPVQSWCRLLSICPSLSTGATPGILDAFHHEEEAASLVLVIFVPIEHQLLYEATRLILGHRGCNIPFSSPPGRLFRPMPPWNVFPQIPPSSISIFSWTTRSPRSTMQFGPALPRVLQAKHRRLARPTFL
jgi:hypothetical protein